MGEIVNQTDRALFRRLADVARRHGPHRDELFADGRVYRHRGIEVGFGGAHLDREAERLSDVPRVRADDLAADYAIGRSVDDKLHQHSAVAADEYRFHRAE